VHLAQANVAGGGDSGEPMHLVWTSLPERELDLEQLSTSSGLLEVLFKVRAAVPDGTFLNLFDAIADIREGGIL